MTYILDVLFVALGLMVDSRLFYVHFAVMLVQVLLREKKMNLEFFLHASIYSIILPDNYLPVIFFAMYFFFNFVATRGYIVKLTRYMACFLMLVAVAVLSTLVNQVPSVNIMFSVISLLPFFAFMWMSNSNDLTLKNIDSDSIEVSVDKVFYIQIFATIINFFTRYGLVVEDWSYGTFCGAGEQAQLFVVMAMLSIFYLYRFFKNRTNRTALYKLIACAFVMITTNSWMLLGMLVIGIGLAYFFSLNPKRFIIVSICLLLLPAALRVGFTVLPDGIKATVNRMFTDEAYFEYRFHKLTVYEETFFEIPSKDASFAFLGNGLGNYNSRGALICTGSYTDFYESMFEPSISEYTEEYIMDYVRLYYTFSSDYGSILARPYASLMSLMGETGYLGAIFFLAAMVCMFKRKRIEIKMLIMIWLSLCFAESYFEYPKVIIALYVGILLITRYESEDKLTDEKKQQLVEE